MGAAETPKEECITSALIEETTGVGVEEHNCLDELEIIFASLKVISLGGDDDDRYRSGLGRCARLRRLSLIDCGLEAIGSLRPISQTLERLCVADQRLTHLRGLGSLPQLRWLYAQQNAIGKLEGLDECPRLRSLWLFSNRIARVEGVAELGELRELWLQENRLSRLGGMEALVSLRDLQLGGNRVADYRDLPRLARLPSLESASFKDAHFGACPVASRDGYRDAVLCALRHVTKLDGAEVTRQDRAAARDAHLEHVLEFNERVDALAREHRRDAAAIEARRKRSTAHARALDAEMRGAFAQLEALVDDGRRGIVEEHARHRNARALSQKALDAALASALAKHVQACGDAAKAAEDRGRRDGAALDALERRAMGERRAALVVASLQYGGPRVDGGPPPSFTMAPPARVACQLLGEHSPDFRWIDARVGDRAGGPARPPADQLSLLRAYRVLRLRREGDAPEDAAAAPPGRRWFFAGSPRDVEDLLRGDLKRPVELHASAARAVDERRRTLVHDDYDSDEFVADEDVFATARAAEACLRGGCDSSSDDDDAADDDPDQLWRELREDERALDARDDTVGRLALLVLCREFLAPADAAEPAAAAAAAGAARTGGGVLALPDGAPANAHGICPEHLLLVGGKLAARDARKLEAELGEDDALGGPTATLLRDLDLRVQAELECHRERVARDLEPKAVDALRVADAELAAREDQLRKRRSVIDGERLAQEHILQNFNAAGP